MRVISDRAAPYRPSAIGYAGAGNTCKRVCEGKYQRVIAACSTTAAFNTRLTRQRKIDIECPGAPMHFSRNDVNQSHRQNSGVSQHGDAGFKQVRSNDVLLAIAGQIAGTNKGWIVISGPAEWSSHIVCL